jgi:hypothetical protein
MSEPPFLVRFGGTIGVATAASLLAAAPGALRLASMSDIGTVRAWLTLAGLMLLPMLVAIPVGRMAREGLRGFQPAEGEGAGALVRVAAVAFFVCTWLWFLSAFGAALRDKTHHRALGAVTFAFFCAASGGLLAMVARRLATILSSIRKHARSLGTAVALLVVVLSVGLVGLRIAHAASFLSFGSRATLVDGLAALLAMAFAVRRSFDAPRLLSRVGPPAAVCVLVVSMHTLATVPAALMGIEHACPLFFTLARFFTS